MNSWPVKYIENKYQFIQKQSYLFLYTQLYKN